MPDPNSVPGEEYEITRVLLQPTLPAQDLIETPPGSGTIAEPLPPLEQAVTVSLAAVEALTATGSNTPGKTADHSKYSFPNYDLHESIGHGGMGIVFRATQHIAKRQVAIKTLNPGAENEPRLRQRFLLEAEAVARLKHENIVQIYEVGEIETEVLVKRPYFSMEYISNGTLSQRLRKTPRLSYQEMAQITRQMAEALVVAHGAGVTHRDIKPNNILLEANNTPKLTDFGLAIVTDVTMDTLPNCLLGTPSYMSPEQAAGKNHEVGPASDIYSLGATLYEMLVGRAPFEGQNNLEIAQKVIQNEVEPPRKLKADVPIGLESICLKCLEKNPQHRYKSAKEFAEDLSRFCRGDDPLARPLTSARKVGKWFNRNRVAVAVATVIVALAIVPFVMNKQVATEPKKYPTDGELQTMLAKGKVTIVPEKGLPIIEPAFFLGETKVGLSDLGDGTSQFQSVNYSLFRLFPEPGTDRYRIRMELRHLFANKPYGDIGLVLGYQQFTSPNNQRLAKMLYINMSDFWDESEKMLPELAAKNHGLKFTEMIMTRPDDKILQTRTHAFDRIFFEPAEATKLKSDPQPWRVVECDVSPEKIDITFTFGTPTNSIKQTKSITRERLEQNMKIQIVDVEKALNQKVNVPQWSPNNPIGLMAYNSIVNFRNVTIESLNK